MRVVSITSAGKADVFNMEVEDTHNYVVNGGFVAHNCYDETRYFLMDHPIRPKQKKPKPKRYGMDPYHRDEDRGGYSG